MRFVSCSARVAVGGVLAVMMTVAAGSVAACPATGTEITTSSGNKMHFDGAADDIRCKVSFRNNGRTAEMIPFMGASEEGFRDNKDSILSLWPIAVGKSTDFMVNEVVRTTSVYWANHVSVARQEKITIPAGTFDVFVIENNIKAKGGSGRGFDGIFTYYYAPAVGYYVKFDFAVNNGIDRNDKAWEAVSITAP